MEVSIYLDVLFINVFISVLIINYVSLTFLKLEVRVTRIVILSILVSIISILLFICNIKSAIIPLVINGILITDNRNIKGIIRYIAFSVLMSITLSGATLLIKNKLGEFNIVVLVISTIVFYYVIKLLKVYIKLLWKLNTLYKITFISKETKNSIYAKLDTGNSLYTKAEHRPICIIEDKVIENYLKDKISYLSDEHMRTALGEDTIKTYVLDEIILTVEEEEKVIKNLVIAIYRGKLDNNDKYNMILHPDVLF